MMAIEYAWKNRRLREGRDVTIETVMSDTAPTPIAPNIRFGLRTMIVVTTVASIFAVAAAPLSWQASEIAQRHLAIAWCMTLFCTAATFAFDYYRCRRLPKKGGPLRYYSSAAWQRPWSPQGPPFWYWLGVAIAPGVLFFWFQIVVENANRPDRSLGWTLWIGAFIGFCTAKAFRPMVSWPIALAEHGIVEYGKLLPWERFFRAEWLADRPGVVQFQRCQYDYLFQGDPCLQVIPEQQSAVASFLSKKIVPPFRET